MDELVQSVYILMVLLAYVMRRAGTFTMSEKVEMLEFVSRMVRNPKLRILLGSHHDLTENVQLEHETKRCIREC